MDVHIIQKTDQKGHSHNHQQLKGRSLLLSIGLNIIITIFQVIGSIVSGSLSLLSDAIHNMSDVLALIVSLIAEKLSLRNTTASKTFGYKRAEILAALINSTSLIIIAVFLIREAFFRILYPSNLVIEGEWVIGMAALGILANGLSVILLKKHAHNSLNIKSAYLHLFTDMLSSIAVLIGGLLIFLKQIYWIDSVLTILIGLYLLYSSWTIFTDTVKILMHFAPEGIDIYEIKANLELIHDVNNVHHMHIWNLNDRQIHFECHAELCHNLTIQEINPIHLKIRDLLSQKYGIKHITVQFEYSNCADK